MGERGRCIGGATALCGHACACAQARVQGHLLGGVRESSRVDVPWCRARQAAARLRAIRNYRCAIWIQCAVRGKLDRDRTQEKRFRLWLVEHEKVLAACVHVQRVIRGKLGRIAARTTLFRRVHVVNIQRVWKGYRVRKQVTDMYATR
jgi:hypothetical protein